MRLLPILFLSLFSLAASAERPVVYVPGTGQPPPHPEQVVAAIAAAVPVAEAHAPSLLNHIRLRDFPTSWITTRDPRLAPGAIPAYRVIEIGRKDGISRVAVRGAYVLHLKDGGLKYDHLTFRVLMDVAPDGRIVGTPEINDFNNLLSTDNGRYYPTNPADGPYVKRRH